MKNYFKKQSILFLTLATCFLQCSSQIDGLTEILGSNKNSEKPYNNITQYDTLTKTIHVYVALCDNVNQGIVPVPEKIGNGQDPMNNLYWGCAYGIKTFFKKSIEWRLLKTQKMNGIILERLIFKHATKNYYLVAEAYDGKYIKTSTINFLASCAGQKKDTLHINKTIIGIHGNAKLLSYIGHDGLMDFKLENSFENMDKQTRDCIILACISKSYFSSYIKTAEAYPLVWTTGLMCPEAYTLHDALSGYVNNESNEAVRVRAALAYSKYQKCSEKAAKNLLVTGW